MKGITHIKNPLTIIGIFAGISEVSGSVVLPFLDPSVQFYFVWFLMVFPIVLIIAFFLTLNFNSKVLYAPSDFTNESNFLAMHKYDVTTQSQVSIPDGGKTIENNSSSYRSTESIGDRKEYKISVSNFGNAEEFTKKLEQKGYSTEVYISPNADPATISSFPGHEAIWLGKHVPVSIAVDVIKEAKKFYPHLKYISISYNNKDAPGYVHHQVYIGGATSTALEYKLLEIPDPVFINLTPTMSKDELHNLIGRYQEK